MTPFFDAIATFLLPDSCESNYSTFVISFF